MAPEDAGTESRLRVGARGEEDLPNFTWWF
jgi:hypothetical protein